MRALVRQEPAFVLHTQPYRETSLLLDVFSRDYGRLWLLAKGARRARAATHGLLMPFQALRLDWGGKGDLKTLFHSEWHGGMGQLSGVSLFCGFYLNELLQRFLARDDPCQGLFEAYDHALLALAGSEPLAQTLRYFELALLRELGYGLDLMRESLSNSLVRVDALYHYRPMVGLSLASNRLLPSANTVLVSGRTLLALAAGQHLDVDMMAESYDLLQTCLRAHLGTEPLLSVVLLRQLQVGLV